MSKILGNTSESLFVVLKHEEYWSPNEAFRRENTLSDAAEDGCTSNTLRAAADQQGSSVAFAFHHSRGQKDGLTSAALAR